jgi:hypothetical protein
MERKVEVLSGKAKNEQGIKRRFEEQMRPWGTP